MADEAGTVLTTPVVAPGTPVTPAVEPTATANTASSTDAAKAEAEAKAKTEADAKAKADAERDAKAKTGAPEKYDDFKLPDGFEVDEALMAEFLPLAKELNLTQDQAQRLVDFQTKAAADAPKAVDAAWEKMLTDWADASRADPEIGGVKFDENLQAAQKFLASFGTPEFKAALDATGVGNHPEFIRAFAKAGKALVDDKLHLGNAPKPKPKGAAELIYPTMNPQ